MKPCALGSFSQVLSQPGMKKSISQKWNWENHQHTQITGCCFINNWEHLKSSCHWGCLSLLTAQSPLLLKHWSSHLSDTCQQPFGTPQEWKNSHSPLSSPGTHSSCVTLVTEQPLTNCPRGGCSQTHGCLCNTNHSVKFVCLQHWVH